MSEQTHENGQTYTIHIEAHGDLRIEGHDGSTVRMRYEDVEQERAFDQDIHIEAHDDAYLQVPHYANIAIENVGGDAAINGIAEVTADNIGGDLRIAEIANGCKVDTVGGDLKANNVANLEIGNVGGDFRGDKLSGVFAIDMIGGDAYIRGELDSMPPMNVGGDLRLVTAWLPDRDYRATVGGDASINVDDGVNLVLSATVGGNVRGIQGSRGPGTISATWGASEEAARVELTVGGDLHVSGASAQASHEASGHERAGRHSDEWSNAFQDFAEEMTSMGREIAAQFRSFSKEWGLNNSEQTAERARRAAERATERAAAAAERIKLRINDREIRIDPERLERIKEQAQRAAEEGIARAQEAIERALSGMDFGNGPRPPRIPRTPRPPRAPRAPFAPRAPQPPQPPHRPQRINIDIEHDEPAQEHEAAPPPPATGQTIPFNQAQAAEATQAAEKSSANLTQERMAILRMVESGKISAEEAALLLEAIG